jgi:rhodanese-related sulfurtransferase
MAKTLATMMDEAKAQIETVSVKEAAAELSSGDAVFLDVREPEEWEEHITGAVQVPRGLLEFAADPASPSHNERLDPGKRVIVYCRSGARATLATHTLMEMGYDDVVNLEGGFSAWQAAGLPQAQHHAGI